MTTSQAGRQPPYGPDVEMRLALRGLRKQIAEALVISEKTVERHRANILEKLGMHDRVELTRYAIRRGLVEP
jgi:DNA-binding NarL/FixJ family response regulator